MSDINLTIAQIRPRKRDYDENVTRIGRVFTELARADDPTDLLVFPETVLSGYFVEGGVADVARPATAVFEDLAAQHRRAGAPPIDVVVGFYEEHRNRYYNSALYATLGTSDAGIVHVHRKVFLPTYGLFDEQRFVQRGHTVQSFPTRFGRAAITICEDVWHSIVPTIAALQGAQVVIVPSASPARGAGPDAERPDGDRSRPVSVRTWERLIRRVAEEHGVFVVLAQLVGFEGGKGFPGSSTIVDPRGDILRRGALFEEDLVRATLVLNEITRARADQPLLADLEVQLPGLLESTKSEGRPDVDVRRTPPAPADRPARETSLVIDPELLAEWLVAFLQEEVTLRRGFASVIVGLSGGIDSAVTAALAARAFGADAVHAVWMPYSTSSAESREHAQLVADTLGVTLRTVDITGAVDGYVAAADPEMSAIRRGNVMARTRMITLFDLSAELGALPLGTGNKTERLLGYFTWHADDSPPVNPLGDLFKTQVRALAAYLGIPEAVIGKPATADLEPGQTDESDLGIAYDRADRILQALVEDRTPGDVRALGFSADEVELVRRRLEGTHWKRHLPTTAVVSGSAIRETYLRPVDY